MTIGYPPYHKARRDRSRDVGYADNVLPFPRETASLRGGKSSRRDEEFLALLSPLLDEAAGFRVNEAHHRDTRNLVLLLEENARLRKLAVKLSNLLGDIPEWIAPAIERGTRTAADDA